jgi:Rod binding domain-containing protein
MNVSPIQAVSKVPEPAEAKGQGKIAESCRQFEAGLWRSLLEKAMSPPKGTPGAAESGSAGKDTYQYFIVQTLADKVAGQPGGLASSLQAQVTHALPKAPPTTSAS